MNPGRILIVDDEPVGRQVLQGLLANQGYDLLTASNGYAALAEAAAHIPDLILLDVMMPDMNGFEVCQRLRADPLLADVPIVMVTALDDRESRLRGIEVGADDFISKPVDRIEIQKRVQTILRLDRYRRLLHERGQRQQAEEEVHRRNRELTLLNHVITAAASTLDVATVLQIALDGLTEAFDLPCACALLLNDDQRSATIIAHDAAEPSAGPAPEASTVGATPPKAGCAPTLEMSPALTALLADQTAHEFVHAQADPRLTPLHSLLRACAIETLLLVPIRTHDRLAGCLLLGTPRQQRFASYDFALARSVAATTGQALETAQLYLRLQRHADELEATVQQRTRELQMERDRTQAILEALGEAVVVTNRAGHIQYVNPAFRTLTGFSSAQVLGQTWHTWTLDSQATDLHTRIERSIQAGQTWRGEVVSQRKDGSSYDSALTVAPIFDPHRPGGASGLVSVQRDMTPLKQAERLKDQFVSNVSHELRTPLSVLTLLSGNLDRLFERLDADKRRKMVRDIREHTQVLNDLINSLLEISRIDGKRIPIGNDQLNLAQLADEERERQLPLAQKKGQQLRTSGAASLPVSGDQSQLRQIIRNLLNNAIKYTPQGGHIWCDYQRVAANGAPLKPTPDADSASPASFRRHFAAPLLDVWPGSEHLAPGQWAALRVLDTGIGIGPEDQHHIFERFYRVRAQSTIPGTGLGLSIVQELVTLYGGHVALSSLPGTGSSFAIYLPLGLPLAKDEL